MAGIVEEGLESLSEAGPRRFRASPLYGADGRNRPGGKAPQGLRRNQGYGDHRPARHQHHRAVYTAQFAGLIYVLHAFQKKSTRGIATPQKEIELISRRLSDALRHYRNRSN